MKLKDNGILILVICALLWSMGGVLCKLVQWDGICISGTRSLVAGITMCILLRTSPVVYCKNVDQQTGKSTVNKKQTLNMWIAAICYSATMISYVVANKLTSSANAILLQYTSPVYIIIFGPWLLKEKNRLSDYLCLIGVLFGMVLFFTNSLGGGNFWGDMISVLSGITWGFSTIFLRRTGDKYSFNAFILAHIITFLVSLPFIVMSIASNGMVSRLTCVGILIMGIFQIGLPSILYAAGLSKVRALTANFIAMIEPIMTPVWVAIFVGEKIYWNTVVGGILVIGCILLRSVFQHFGAKKKLC